MNKSIERKNWIDFARAIGIYAIAFGHLVLGESFLSHYFSSFRVAVFFCIMGLTFSSDNKFFYFLKKKSCRLLIPYSFFSVVSIVVFYVFSMFIPFLSEYKSKSILLYFWGAIYGNGLTGYMKWNLPLWFLPCSFVTLLIVFGYEKLITIVKINKLLLRLAFILISFSVCYIYVCYFKWTKLPFGAEVAIPMSGFVELGIILSKIDCLKKKYQYVVISIPLFILGYCLSRINGTVSVMTLIFGNYYPVYFISSISSIVGIFCLSIWLCSIEILGFLRKVICYCGIHTIAILCMHKFPILFFQQLLPYTKELFKADSDSVQKEVCGFIVTFLVIILCLIVELPIDRFLPQVFGNSIKKKGFTSI